jgi:hypothetical protein
MTVETLDYPPFPLLRWDDYFWVGEVKLVSWAGYQARRGDYDSINSTEPSDGSTHLSVDTKDGNDRGLPTAEQVAGFRHLIENEEAVAAAVGRALVDYFTGVKDAYLDDYDEGEVEGLPDISEPDELRPLIGLSGVHVLSVAREGAAYIGFEFGCVWDEEHGAGVMTHLGRVVATGQAADSFMAWIARLDIERGQSRM